MRLKDRAFAALALGLLLTLTIRARADEKCVPVSKPKDAIEAQGGQWTIMTNDQFQFLRGAAANQEGVPSALPRGDGAALAQKHGEDAAVAFFTEGDHICERAFGVPPVFVEILKQVARGVSPHAGTI